MAKVFVVTNGQYSNYRIVGVFSSRDKASELCPAAAGEETSAVIEEWELDQLDEKGFLQAVYWTEIGAKTGTIDSESTGIYSPPAEFKPHRWSEVRLYKLEGYPDKIYAHSVVSQEHARKLAIEAHQKYIRGEAFESEEPEEISSD